MNKESLKKYLFGSCEINFNGLFKPQNDWVYLYKSLRDDYLLKWFSYGFFGTFVCYFLSRFSNNPYLFDAIKQIPAPLFWNLTCILASLFYLLSSALKALNSLGSNKKIADMAANIFKFTAEGGTIGLGVTLALFFISLAVDHVTLKYLLLAVATFMIAIPAIVVNLIVCWITIALKDDNAIPVYFNYIRTKSSLYTLSHLVLLALVFVSIYTTTLSPS
jgi:hypothetical protein